MRPGCQVGAAPGLAGGPARPAGGGDQHLSPGAKYEAKALLQEAGVPALDCALSGTGAQAEKRDLVILASGDEEACRRCQPVFEAIGRASYYLANLLVAVHNVAAAEAFVMGMQGGLAPALM